MTAPHHGSADDGSRALSPKPTDAAANRPRHLRQREAVIIVPSAEAMSMKVGIPRETSPIERRVALVPAAVEPLRKKGMELVVEAGAGLEAGYPDEAYRAAGAEVQSSRADLFAAVDVITVVRAGASDRFEGDAAPLSPGQIVVGLLDPLGAPAGIEKLAATGVSAFAMELIPRITRAQAMDVLSSMASLAGYKAVLLAAAQLPRVLPMMMTAAGTLSPARVLVLGAGVAGLSAIATAKRLGAVVEAYDVRPEVREQVQSVGGRFIDLPLATTDATDKGGYAKAQSAELIAEQQRLLAPHVRGADVVITTAAVPGRRAPRLVTAAMQQGMKPGSVIVDLAAEMGGNCELTRAGETFVIDGVTMTGPLNVPASVPFHASQLYSRNLVAFLSNLFEPEQPRDAGDRAPRLRLRLDDPIVNESLVTRDGEVASDKVRAALTKARAPETAAPHSKAASARS